MASRTWDLLADLPLRIDSVSLEPLKIRVSEDFERWTMHVTLRGAGGAGPEEGHGEDVTWEVDDHRHLLEHGPAELVGEHTLASLSRALGDMELFPPSGPSRYASRQYRRWAYESAALDLALRQAGRPLHDVLGRKPRAVRFVASPGLGSPPSIQPIDAILARQPEMQFKLDASSAWSPNLMRTLSALGHVKILDLKGAYRGTPVDQPADRALYESLLKFFDDVLLEDPDLTDEVRDLFDDVRLDRITWDAPIHSTADIEALPFPPRVLNFKPSRFGSLEALFDAYDHCHEQGISIYGGGQFELGPGRGQIQ
ncbi:MAG: hypothetical protein KC583_23535, partial [Myxococcales bacterium]|nr:hypothetical protein [Myxococcales bacterium]